VRYFKRRLVDARQKGQMGKGGLRERGTGRLLGHRQPDAGLRRKKIACLIFAKKRQRKAGHEAGKAEEKGQP